MLSKTLDLPLVQCDRLRTLGTQATDKALRHRSTNRRGDLAIGLVDRIPNQGLAGVRHLERPVGIDEERLRARRVDICHHRARCDPALRPVQRGKLRPGRRIIIALRRRHSLH
jgi:hypothetical protein